jgi:hypothetical protein
MYHLLAGRIGRRFPWRTARQPPHWDIPAKIKENKKNFDINFFFLDLIQFLRGICFQFWLPQPWPTTVAKKFRRTWNNIFCFLFYNAPGFITESPPHPTHVLIRVELLKEKSGTPLPTKSFIFRRAAYVYMRGERERRTSQNHTTSKKIF